MGALRLIAGALVTLWCVVVMFGGMILGVHRCDEGCEDPAEGWTQDPNAFQWDVISAGGMLAAAGGVLMLAVAADDRRKPALVLWALSSLGAATLAGLILALAGTSAGVAVAIVLAGPALGLVVVRG